MERVVITGPTGAIGMALTGELLQHGYDVYAVCHRDSGRNKRICETERLHPVCCNLDEYRTLPERIGKPCDLFYHMAWSGTTGAQRNDAECQLNNIRWTLDAVEAAHRMKCRRFIGLGSQAEYGRYEGILREDTPVFPENGYGMAKLAAGQLSRLRCEQLKIEHIWTRVLSVYGPYDTGQSMIMSVIGELLCGTSPKTTAGEQIWDYLYAKDAATALRLLGERGEPGELYCLGSGRGIPLRRYIHAIEQAVGNSQKVKLGALAYSDAQVMHLQADVSKLKRDTGFVPDFSFEEGIRETVKWYMDQEETNLICEK